MGKQTRNRQQDDPDDPVAEQDGTALAQEQGDGAQSAEQTQSLKAEAGKAKHYYDQWVRAAADLENYKKRAARERHDSIRFANETLIERLIPVLDNFDSALAATSAASEASVQSLQTGISMIYQQLKTALSEAGLEEIDASNKPFDPNWHEALSQQPSSEVPEGHVLQQLRKGYKLRERLLRPAGVVVAKKPAA
ncbi:MAG TPA: nucleotide exchange factor GrpE [Verrucomicrobiae bacterium]|nr:nucleotide exchange factor GrpE [Verrucomicrobiae bacterium]